MKRLALVVLALVACEVPADNPFDPATPEERQAKAGVQGSVVAPNVSPETVALTLTSPGREPRTMSPAADGTFAFAEVVPGDWSLAVAASGYYPLVRDLRLPAGMVLDLGAIVLVPVLDEAKLVVVEGSARLANQRSSAGITVEVVGTAFSATTNPEGRYALRLTPGRYTLEFTATGFRGERLEDLTVPEGASFSVADVTLTPNPASIAGHVCAEIRDDLRRQGATGGEGACAPAGAAFGPASNATTAALVTVRGPDSPDGRSTTVDADGFFSIGDLSPGAYLLTVEWPGYRRAFQQSIAVAGGDDVVLPAPLLLELARGGIEGVVKLPDGAADHSGTLVTVEGWNVAATTDARGRFSLGGLLDSALVGDYQLFASHRPTYADLRLPVTVQVEADRFTTLPRDYTLDVRTGAVRVKEGFYLRACALTLVMEAPTAETWRVSLLPDLSDATPQPFQPPNPQRPDEFPWELPGCDTLADGRQTIYVEFTDESGTPDAPVAVDVLLDRKPPVQLDAALAGAAPQTLEGVSGPVFFTRSSGGIVALELFAIDPLAVESDDPSRQQSGSGVFRVAVDEDPAFTSPTELPFSTAISVPLPVPGTDGTKELFVRFEDRAGNAAVLSDEAGSPRPVRIVLDRVGPRDLSAVLRSLATPPPPDETFTPTPQVALELAGDDEYPELLAVRVSNDAGFRGAGWQPFSPFLPWVLAPGDGEKTVHVQFRDAAGNEAPVVPTRIRLSTQPPANASATVTSPVVREGRVSASAAAANGLGLALSATGALQMEIYGDIAGTTTGWLDSAETWSGALTTGDGTKTVQVRFRSPAGNVANAPPIVLVLDGTAPIAGALSVSPGPFTATTAVTLQIPATGADEVRITGDVARVSNLPANVGAWLAAQPSMALELTTGDGAKAITVELRDFAGNVAAPVQTTATLDTTAPVATAQLVSANDDGETSTTLTATPQVTLRVTSTDGGSGVARLRAANVKTDLATATWRAAAPTIAWTLLPGDGAKTVYVQVEDAVGNASSLTTPVEAATTLDTTPPGSPSASVARPTATGGAVPATAADTNGFELGLSATNADELLVSGSIAGGTTGWIPYATTWTGALTAGDGAKTVQVRFRDAAGNVADASPLNLVLDGTAPVAGAPSVTPASFTKLRRVQLTVASTGADEMRIAGDLSSVGGSPASFNTWIAVRPALEVELTDTDGAKTITVELRDRAGNTTRAPDAAVALDTTAPTGSLSVRGPVRDGAISAALSSTAQVTLDVTAADAGSGAARMRLGNSVAELAAASWRSFSPQVPWTLSTGDGAKTVFLQLEDLVGNQTSASVPISAATLLDTTPPGAAAASVTTPAPVAGYVGAAATETNGLVLAVSATGADQMEISGTIPGGSTGWLPYATSWTGALQGGDGPKSVSVRFRDAAGHVASAAALALTLDTELPVAGTPTLSPAPYTGARRVSLSMPATGAADMRITGDVTAVGGSTTQVNAWIAARPSVELDLTTGDGAKTVTVELRDQARNTAAGVTATTTLDTTAPTGALVVTGVAADGATSSTLSSSAAVTLAITGEDGASGAAQLRLGNTAAELGAASWRTFAPSLTWTLAAGDGAKTVYLQLKDGVGNTTPLATPVTAGITLDTTAPASATASITTPAPVAGSVPGGATAANGLVLALSATGATQMELSGGIAGGTTGWVPYATTWTGALQGGDGAKSIAVRFRDGAGNVSSAPAIGVTLDTAGPVAGSPSLSPAPYTGARAVVLSVDGSGADEMRVSGDVSTVAGQAPNTWVPARASVSIELSTGDGAKSVTVQLRDFAGNTASAQTVQTTLDQTAPAGSFVLVGPAGDGSTSTSFSNSAAVTLALTTSDAAAGVTQVRIANSAAELANASWRAAAATVPWTLPAGDGAKTVYVQLQDAVGNATPLAAPLTASTTLDTSGPTAPGAVVTAPVPVNGAVGGAATAADGLALALTATGAVSMEISGAIAGTTTGWIPFAATWTGALQSGDGMKGLAVRFRDGAGNVTSAPTLSLVLDTTAPSAGSPSVEPSPYVRLRSVVVSVPGTGADEMKLTGDLATVSGLPTNVGLWIPARPTVNVEVSTDDGVKTITVQVRDAAGNTAPANATTVTLDTAAPTSTLALEGPVANGDTSTTLTSTTQVTLRVTATDALSGLGQMRVSNVLADLANATWRPFGAALPWTLATGDGSKTVYVQLQDAVGNTSSVTAPFSATTTLDTRAPTGPAVTLTAPATTGGYVPASATAANGLTLGLAATGATHMELSGALSVGTTGWVAYATSWTGALATGDGAKTILARFRDAAGNVASAAPLSLTLDTTGPALGTPATTPATATRLRSVTVSIPATGADEMRLTGHVSTVGGSSTNVGAWLAAAPSVAVELTTGDGDKTITVEVRDRAGNTAGSASTTITLDTGAPAGSLLLSGPVADGATSTTLTGSTQVTAQVTATDDGSDVTLMRLANTTGALSTASWVAFAPVSTWTLPAGDGPKTVYLQLQDAVGNLSSVAAPVQGQTTLDLTAPTSPTAAVTTPAPVGGVLPSSATAANGLVLATSATGAAQMEISGAISGTTTGWISHATSWTGALASGDGPKSILVRYRDAAGNVSNAPTLALTLDTTGPVPGTPSLSLAPYTGTRSLVLATPASGADEMRVTGDVSTVDGQAAGTWIAARPNVPVELSTGDALKTISVQFRDLARNTTSAVAATTTLDTAAPTGSVTIVGTIADGVSSTTLTSTSSVTVQVAAADAASGATLMRLANTTGELATASWRAVSAAVPWTLTAGENSKSVYLQLQDAVGNVSSVSAPIVGTTVVDGSPPSSPTASVTTPTPRNGFVPVSAAAANGLVLATGATGAATMEVSGSITGGTTGWIAYATSWTGALATGDGAKTLSVRYRDPAGNVASAAPVALVLDGTAPVAGTPSVSPAPYAGGTSVTLSLPSTGADEMRITAVSSSLASVNGLPANVGAWIAVSPTATAVLTAGDGLKTVSVQYRDFAGNSSASVTAATTLDVAGPTGGVSISGPVASGTSTTLTGSAQVTLQLTGADTGAGVTEMRLGNTSGELASAPWRAFATTLPWTLASGDGAKSVLLELRDDVGNVTTGLSASTYCDLLKPSAPVLSVTLPATRGPGNAIPTASVAFTVTTTDATTATGALQVLVSGDVAAGSTGWLSAGASGLTFAGSAFTWSGSLSAGEGPKAVSVQVRDAAGNVSDTATVSFVVQTTAPASPTLAVTPTGFTRSRNVTLALSAVGASKMLIAGGNLASVNASGANVGVDLAYATSATATLVAGDGPKAITASFKNDAGLSANAAPASVTLDETPPTGTLTIQGPVDQGLTSTTRTGSRQVTLVITGSDGAGAGVERMRLADSLVALSSAAWVPFQVSAAWTLPAGDGAKSVFLQLRDAVGNDTTATIQGGTTLDLTPPTAPVLAALPVATNADAVSVSLAALSTDGLSAPVRYEWLTTGLSSWTGVTFPATLPLVAGTNALRVRAIDQAGNVSPEASASLVRDTTAPPTPVIVTPRTFVNATTTSASLAGSEADANFLTYRTCTALRLATQSCSASCATWADAGSSFALSLSPGQKTCLSAKAVDAAGNESAVATVGLVSDLTRPLAPEIGPQFTPESFVARAGSAQAFLLTPATDEPLGGTSSPWVGVLFLEIGGDGGFTPLCPTSLNGNAWDPCNPLAPNGRCADERLRCRGTTVMGFDADLREGARTTVSVRAVDLAGNVSDAQSFQVDTEAPFQVTSAGGVERWPNLYGTTLGYGWESPADGVVPRIIELGQNRRVDPSDPSCTLDPDAPSYYSYESVIGAAGAVYQDNSNAVMLRRRGADGLFCTGDDPAPVKLHPLGANPPLQYDRVSTGGQAMAFLNRSAAAANSCTPVVVRETGYDFQLGTVDDWMNTLPTATLSAFTSNGWGVPLQLADGAMLIYTAGCPSPGSAATEWKVVQPYRGSNYLSYVYGAPRVFTFQGNSARLSSDGRQLLSVGGTVTLRHVGKDGFFGTTDDRVATRSLSSFGSSPAIDGTRAIFIVDAGGGRAAWRIWGAGPDGVFQSAGAADDDDDWRLVYPSSESRSNPTLAFGLAVFESRGNLYGMDLSQKRWEVVPQGRALFPQDSGAGGLLYVEDADYLDQVLVARSRGGGETTGTFPFSLQAGSERAHVADGNNLLVVGSSGGGTVLEALRRPNNLPWFVSDTRRTLLSVPEGGDKVFPIAAGGGKALVFRGPWVNFNKYVLEPGAGGSWAAADATLVDVTGGTPVGHNIDGAGISATHVAWQAAYTVYVRASGPDERFGTADDSATAPLLQTPGGPAYSVDDSAFGGTRIALLDRDLAYIRVVEAGLDKLFSTADDVVQDVPVGVKGVCRYDCWVSVTDDAMSWVSPDAAGVDQLYFHDFRTRSTIQVTNHDSTKEMATQHASGRLLWIDRLFPQQSIFSFTP